jgi:hypothetical protein
LEETYKRGGYHGRQVGEEEGWYHMTICHIITFALVIVIGLCTCGSFIPKLCFVLPIAHSKLEWEIWWFLAAGRVGIELAKNDSCAPQYVRNNSIGVLKSVIGF